MSRSRSGRGRLPLLQHAHPAFKRTNALQRRGHDGRRGGWQRVYPTALLMPAIHCTDRA
ncbi:hypothetical protein EIELFIGP_03123 [Stenotrophomonas maltophilia]|nr:hypothetical protein EIELFIGP_03123 [Stenotrophomonas maltophilia]QNG80692.1 hypothetical protein FLFIOBJN_00675 [Stenotrophomonas maltophilia]